MFRSIIRIKIIFDFIILNRRIFREFLNFDPRVRTNRIFKLESQILFHEFWP